MTVDPETWTYFVCLMHATHGTLTVAIECTLCVFVNIDTATMLKMESYRCLVSMCVCVNVCTYVLCVRVIVHMYECVVCMYIRTYYVICITWILSTFIPLKAVHQCIPVCDAPLVCVYVCTLNTVMEFIQADMTNEYLLVATVYWI